MGDDPRDRSGVTALALAFSATLLFAGALRAFLSSVYYHNLTELGLNATALYALLLLAPLLYFVPVRYEARTWALVAIAGLAVARIGMAVLWGGAWFLPLAGLAVGAYMLLLPALAASGRPALAAVGVGLAWALDAALLLASRSEDPLAGRGGLPAIAILSLLALLLAFAGPPAEASGPATRARRHVALAGLGVGAWLFLEHVFLASPWTLARWTGAAPWSLGGATILGLVAGGVISWTGRRLPRGLFIALNGAVVAALVDAALFQSPALPLLVALAQGALVLDLVALFQALGDRGIASAGQGLALGALATLVLHFGFAFSFTFAYVPLGALWKGAEQWLLPGAAALVALAALALTRQGLVIPRAPRRILTILLLVPLVTAPTGLLEAAAPVVEPAPEAPLRVAAFNVHQGFDNGGVVDARVFVEVVRELDADVVALQESDTVRFTSANVDVVAVLAHELGYHAYYGQPTREQSVGMALLSRFPITEASWHRLPTTTDHRFFVEARLDVHGAPLWVYVVHMGLELPDRVDQTQALLERAATRAPRLLVGDFNSCPEGTCPDFDGGSDDVYARVLAAGHQDAWVAAGHPVTDPAGWTFETREPIERIDYVFASNDMRVVSVERVRSEAVQRASDHMPVVAVVDMP